MPLSISSVSAASGSATFTRLNRRSMALSCSIVRLNSSRVVAPISRSSPLASCGFRILAASIAPSAAPVPMILCSSSMKSITSPAAAASSVQAFRRSSKSPRYFAPASSSVRSREKIRLPESCRGTFPETILAASPSTTAVFPTPASPVRQGLFLFLRQSISIIQPISLLRPISGSNPSQTERRVSSRPYFSRCFSRGRDCSPTSLVPSVHWV